MSVCYAYSGSPKLHCRVNLGTFLLDDVLPHIKIKQHLFRQHLRIILPQTLSNLLPLAGPPFHLLPARSEPMLRSASPQVLFIRQNRVKQSLHFSLGGLRLPAYRVSTFRRPGDSIVLRHGLKHSQTCLQSLHGPLIIFCCSTTRLDRRSSGFEQLHRGYQITFQIRLSALSLVETKFEPGRFTKADSDRYGHYGWVSVMAWGHRGGILC
jgi:hypothetical protein